MARYIGGHQANPNLLGEDVVGLAWEAAGLGLTAFVNDKLIAPIARQFSPSSMASGTMAKLVDAATTAASAWVLGTVTAMADSGIGRRIKRGGAVLAIAKVISVVIPGFAISASVPISVPQLTSGAASSGTAQLKSGSNGTAATSQVPARPAAVGIGAI